MTVDVYLHVVPEDALVHSFPIRGYSPSRDGKQISTVKQVNFNGLLTRDQTPAYSLIFGDTTFRQLDAIKLLSAIIATFAKNRPGDNMRLHLKYSYVGAYGEDLFDRDTMHKLYVWNDLCTSIDRAKKIPLFQYDEESMEELADAVADHEEDVDDLFDLSNYDDDDDDDDDDEDEDDDEDDEEADPYDFVEDDDEEDEEDPLHPLDPYEAFVTRPSRSRERNRVRIQEDPPIRRSKVFRNAKNPKRDVERHGVIVYRKKEDLDRDRAMLKEFLQYFIPGDKPWIKRFRKDVLKRWISMYAISKKTLNAMQRAHRERARAQAASHGYGWIDAGLAVANKMITSSRANDKWNNPNL